MKGNNLPPNIDTIQKAKKRHGWSGESPAHVFECGFHSGAAWQRGRIRQLLQDHVDRSDVADPNLNEFLLSTIALLDQLVDLDNEERLKPAQPTEPGCGETES